ncbi:ficolin-1-like [Drosophila miranda]|uniref:ficolin-1-like n=1 Tax=Drosophila miranda TaxID=7229 RepID=UPI0007E83BB9|nr:ficolin-1-like [Drosophila miranda]
MLKYSIFVLIFMHLTKNFMAETNVDLGQKLTNLEDQCGFFCFSPLNFLLRFLSSWEEKMIQIEPPPTSCRAFGYSSEIHVIHVPGLQPFAVPCDSQMAGPGWTVVMRKIDCCTDSFSKNWTEYKQGFGEINGTFFIGLEKLHLMTKASPQKLYLYAKENGKEFFGKWFDFRLGNEDEGFNLKSISHLNGTIYDYFQGQVNVTFSTYDRENYVEEYYRPAYVNHGGWWYSQTNIDSPTRLYYYREFVQMIIRDQT